MHYGEYEDKLKLTLLFWRCGKSRRQCTDGNELRENPNRLDIGVASRPESANLKVAVGWRLTGKSLKDDRKNRQTKDISVGDGRRTMLEEL